MIAAIPDFTVKKLAVNGKDLLALGYEGAQIGQALERLLNAVVFENIENKKETLLHHLNKT